MSYLRARCPVRIKAPAFGAGEPGFKTLRARHFLGARATIQQEVIEKKFLENLLSKENWQATGAEVRCKVR